MIRNCEDSRKGLQAGNIPSLVEKGMKGFIQKEIAKPEFKEEPIKPKTQTEDLEIPAFIRKKMGN